MRVTVRSLQQFLPRDYPVIYCNDGFTVQIMCSPVHRCVPMSDQGPWRKAEVRYPSQVYMPIRLYARNKHALTKTVYYFVPLNLVCDMLNAHDGINVERTRKQTAL